MAFINPSHGLVFTLTWILTYRRTWAFPHHVQMTEFSTGGLQSRRRSFSKMIKGNGMHQGHISSVRAKGLNIYVNVLGQKTLRCMLMTATCNGLQHMRKQNVNKSMGSKYFAHALYSLKYKPLITDREQNTQHLVCSLWQWQTEHLGDDETLFSVVAGEGGMCGHGRRWRKRGLGVGRRYRPKQVWQFWKLSWGKKGFSGLVAMLNWAWPSDSTQPSLSLSCLNRPRTGKPFTDTV